MIISRAMTHILMSGLVSVTLLWNAGCSKPRKASPEDILWKLVMPEVSLPEGGKFKKPAPDKGIPSNPYISSDREFANMMARRLFGRGFDARQVRASLICFYEAPREIGIEAVIFENALQAQKATGLLLKKFARRKPDEFVVLWSGLLVGLVLRDGHGHSANWDAVVKHVKNANIPDG